MNDITFECPHCTQSLECSPEKAGVTIDCPFCQTRVSVPLPKPRVPIQEARKRVILISIIAACIAVALLAAGIGLHHYLSGRNGKPLLVPPINGLPSSASESKIMIVVGNGIPYRPTVDAGDDEQKKACAEQWKKQIQVIRPSQLEEMLKAENGWRFGPYIEAGLSPWIVKLQETTKNNANHCIPGSIIEVKISRVWDNPTEGKYTLTAPTLQPSYELIGGPYGFNGWFKTKKGGTVVICVMSVLARVPVSVSLGTVVLRATGDANAPGESSSSPVASEYHLLIESPPHPDAETVLSYFAYVVNEAKEEKRFFNQRNREENKYATHAIELLRLFAAQLDGETQLLAKEALDRSAFKEAVLIIEEGKKKDMEAAKSESQH